MPTLAYASVSEFKQGWSLCVLVIRRQIQPELVTSAKASRIGYQRNPIAHLLSVFVEPDSGSASGIKVRGRTILSPFVTVSTL